MKVIRNPQALSDCVATIGNFDGLHKGHVQIISAVVNFARELALPATLITFEPLPQAVLAGNDTFMRLMSFRQKVTLLAEKGITQLVCFRFNAAFSKLAPDYFVKKYLRNVKYLVVGEDFRFGYQKAGDIETLKQHLYKVISLPLMPEGDQRISSTAIREALIQGDCQRASLLLGRPYEIERRVVHGQAKGRLLGFPTANLLLPKDQQILKGVFLCMATVDEKDYFALANMGTRPTLSGKHYVAEIHLLQFSGDLYGKRLRVSFLQKIRDERRFESLEALKQQIQQDIREAMHDR